MHLVKGILVGSMAAWSVWSLAWQAVLWGDGVRWERGLYLWAAWLAVPTLLAALGFLLFERHLVLVFSSFSATALLGLALVCGLVYRRGLGAAFAADARLSMALLFGAYYGALSAAVYTMRRGILGRARRLLDEDRHRHDAVWGAAILAEPDAAASLAALARTLATALPSAAPRQLALGCVVGPVSWYAGLFRSGARWSTMFTGSWWKGLLFFWSKGPVAPAALLPDAASQPAAMTEATAADVPLGAEILPIHSLDQLYAQAMHMHARTQIYCAIPRV